MAIDSKDKTFELNAEQITDLIRLADFNETDIFYDMGSGKGQVVIQVAKQTKVKKSIGIEKDKETYEKARRTAIDELTLEQRRKTDFWYGDMDARQEDGSDYFYDIWDATVVYYSLHEGLDDVLYYRRRFGKRRLKIITKDLPIVGYRSQANRSNPDCWFFLMRYPLRRITTKKQWVRSVLGRQNATIDDVYEYFAKQLEKRPAHGRKSVIDAILNLKQLVNKRF